jgi:hypothetical protein
MMAGLWDNIHAKRARIKEGSGERMRSPGDPGAPTDKALRESQFRKGGAARKKSGFIAVGCGKVMKNRRKKTRIF